MNAWLDAHVGPSTLAPDDDALARFGPLQVSPGDEFASWPGGSSDQSSIEV